MNTHAMRLILPVCTLLVSGLVLSAGAAFAKRLPPEAVEPLVHEGVRYEAPPFDEGCGQNGGCILAYDAETGTELWQLQVYCTRYVAELEADVQDVFITSLVVDGEQLIVTDEKERRFAVDLSTRVVSGDDQGCGQAHDAAPDVSERAANAGCGIQSTPRHGGTVFAPIVLAFGLYAARRSRRSRRPRTFQGARGAD